MRSLVQQLESEGWALRAEALQELVEEHGAADLRSALLDTDLKEFGARCLPLRQRKSGLLVLQVSSIENIGDSRGHGHGRRLLRVLLTDGHSTVTAIEYRPVASLSEDVPPGTKVLVKDARVQNGFLLLEEQCLKVLGGHVPVLYEGWEIQRKYSGSARALLNSSTDLQGAPMFRGLKSGVGRNNQPASQPPAVVDDSKSHKQQPGQPSAARSVPSGGADGRMNAIRAAAELNPEAGPAQNHAAAQKLLDRKVEDDGARRGRMARGRGRKKHEVEEPVLTLEEWEARKSAPSTSTKNDVSGDEEFARRLQQQLNMGQETSEAERIRQSMFNFSAETRTGSNERQRGRGRRGRRH